MAVCYDTVTNKYEYCTSHLSTYIAVGIFIPLGILTIVLLVYIYYRCKQRRLRQAQQQVYMATIVPIYNTDNQQVSYAYPYPPHYASMPQGVFDKPPTYEQTIQEISETNNNSVENPSTVPPVTPVVPTENPN